MGAPFHVRPDLPMTYSEQSLCLHPEDGCPATNEISRLRKEMAELEQQIIRDPLTGLYNKRHFNSVLTTEMERTRRTSQPTSLILADLDSFKSINDRYGHPIGDLVLCHAATVIRSMLRMIDIPCRYGGEEFAIILPATPLPIAVQVAERLRIALKSAWVETGKGALAVTASFGVSSFKPGESLDTFLQRTDEKLYEAKRKGKDRVCADTAITEPEACCDEKGTAHI